MGLDALEQGVGADEVHEGELLFAFFGAPLLVTVLDRLAVGEACGELLLASVELLLSELVAEDELIDVVPEVGHLAGRAARSPPKGDVEAQGLLRLQIRIPELDGEVPVVEAVEEQFFERGVTSGSRQARGNRQPVVGGRWPEKEADRTRPIREIALRLAQWLESHAIEPSAELNRGVWPCELFVREERKSPFVDRRRERLRALRIERPVECPESGAAFQATERPVRAHQLDLGRVVFEGRAHLIAFELVVLVALL